MKKKCPKCKLNKNSSEFSKDSHKKDGRCSWCKECIKNKKLKNHIKEKIYRDNYYQSNKERLLLWQKERNIINPEKRRNVYRRASLKLKYGITQDEYNKLFEEQNGCCAICGKHQSEFKKALHIDHNHKTGKVRGLLCFNCNMGIGRLQDSKELLLKAVDYLER